MLSLYIDTSQSDKLTLIVDDGKEKKEKQVDATFGRAQMVLPELEDFLKNEHKTLQDLTSITIHTGPGSFTGLRVGTAIARTLSALLHISINGLKPGSLPELAYGEDKWNLQISQNKKE